MSGFRVGLVSGTIALLSLACAFSTGAAAAQALQVPAQSSSSTMTVRQARRALVNALERVYRGERQHMSTSQKRLRKINVTSTGFEFLDEGVESERFGSPQPYSIMRTYSFLDMGHVSLTPVTQSQALYEVHFASRNRQGPISFVWENQEDAQAFVSAVARLVVEANGSNLGAGTYLFAVFRQQAAAWRRLATKPALADDVKHERILAESALNEKDLASAIDHYEAGLEIDPLWAQGQFNAAWIRGELGDFAEAIWHMRCYLELLPEAPDAQQARDQLVIWQDKAARQGVAVDLEAQAPRRRK
ncbi:MAG: hypothetical protein ACHQQS_17925 [Thermoanaerobaculales bacterium]